MSQSNRGKTMKCAETIVAVLSDRRYAYRRARDLETVVRARLGREGVKHSTFHEAINYLMKLPSNDERRIERYPPERERQASYYFLVARREEARMIMILDDIIKDEEARVAPYRPSHTADVRRFVSEWKEKIPDISTDLECESGFLPVKGGVVLGGLATHDCTERYEL